MRLLRNILLPVLSGLLAVTGVTLGMSKTVAAQELTKLVLQLNYVPSGFHAPFFYALKMGWYKQAGLDVEILDGRGSGPTINLVGAGQADIGYADLSATSIAISKGVPVKAIAAILRTSAQGVIVHHGEKLNTPEDFRGKEIIYNNASASEPALFRGFLATAGMTDQDVRMVGVDSASKEAAILAERGDAAIAPIPYLQALLTAKGRSVEKAHFVKFADFGMRLLDMGLLSNPKTIETKGDALRAFLKVTSRAYQYTISGGAEDAVDAMIALRPDSNIDRKQALGYIKYDTPWVQSIWDEGKPIGYMSEKDWGNMVQILTKIGLLKGEVDPSSLYDPSFQPQ
jgi:NitT/TauT family transport system substrate-binding protein